MSAPGESTWCTSLVARLEEQPRRHNWSDLRLKTRGSEGPRNRCFIMGDVAAAIVSRRPCERSGPIATGGHFANAVSRSALSREQRGMGSCVRRNDRGGLYEIPITSSLLPSRKPMRPVAPQPGKTRTVFRRAGHDAQEHSHAGHCHAGARFRLLRRRHRLRLCLRTAVREQDHDLRLFARRPRLVGPAVLPDLRPAAA